jgi:hypothetical protein
MLDWNDIHPYNAVHVVRVAQSLELDRLEKVVSLSLNTLGLHSFTLDPRRKTFDHQSNSAPVEIVCLRNQPGSAASLESEIEAQLNRSFDSTVVFNPFRFFVQAEEASFYFGLTYFHPVADAESIVLLLKHCVESYEGRQPADSIERLELYPRLPGPLLSRHPRAILGKLAAMPAGYAAFRRSYRPPCRDGKDLRNGFAFFSLPVEKLRALTAASKSWAVTFNDIFLAILMKCFSPLAARRTQSGKRRRIALGCIVNLRKELGLDNRAIFGLFLGSFVVTHEAPDTLSLMGLAQDICRQTREIKAKKLYLGTPIELGFGRLLLGLFSTERRRKLYQKHYPLWGGITNMNLNSIWKPREDAGRFDYFRAVSTGPATPFVLSTTTVDDHVNIGITYRSGVYSRSDIDRIRTDLMNCVDQLKTNP